jgi:DNA-binding response OmpR family regulator
MAFVPKILIVSAEQGVSPLWAFDFTQQPLRVILESNPAKTLQRWAEILPDVLIFNIDSKALAIERIAELREEAVLPILLLTSLHDEKFLLETYKAGVDECILKPVSPALFHAKVKAWLRRSWNIPAGILDPLRLGKFHLIPEGQAIEVEGGTPIHLTTLEVRLLYYLMGRPGHAVTTDELYERVWGLAGEGGAVTLKNLIYRLRQKIEVDPANPRYVLTVTGIGYRFIAE